MPSRRGEKQPLLQAKYGWAAWTSPEDSLVIPVIIARFRRRRKRTNGGSVDAPLPFYLLVSLAGRFGSSPASTTIPWAVTWRRRGTVAEAGIAATDAGEMSASY